MKFRPLHLICILLFSLMAGVAFSATTETTGTLTGTVAVWGYSISFGMVLSWLLVPLAYVVTEIAPVPDNFRPAVPFILGAIAGLTGHFLFGIEAKEAQAQFFGALAAGNMSGWIKVLLPWLKAHSKGGA